MRSVAVPRDRVAGYLAKKGMAAEKSRRVALSFGGPVNARIAEKGESFVRYANQAGSKGSFLTDRLFPTGPDAVRELFLAPYGTRAVVRQMVRTMRPSIVIEGSIANGGVGVTQTLTTDSGAFKYGLGAGTW
jgi:hypothetical protein